MGRSGQKCLNIARKCGWTFSLGVWSPSYGVFSFCVALVVFSIVQYGPWYGKPSMPNLKFELKLALPYKLIYSSNTKTINVGMRKVKLVLGPISRRARVSG